MRVQIKVGFEHDLLLRGVIGLRGSKFENSERHSFGSTVTVIIHSARAPPCSVYVAAIYLSNANVPDP